MNTLIFLTMVLVGIQYLVLIDQIIRVRRLLEELKSNARSEALPQEEL